MQLHIHDWRDVSRIGDDIDIETCSVPGCTIPFRWRHAEGWDWIETSKDPRDYWGEDK